MEIRKGIFVSPGVTICEAFVLDSEEYRIPERFVSAETVEREVAENALALESAEEVSACPQEASSEVLPEAF